MKKHTNFSANLRTIRKTLGITQQELADGLGISPSKVGSWEEGTAEPNIEMLVKLSKYFRGLSLEFLMCDNSVNGNFQNALASMLIWQAFDKKNREKNKVGYL